MLVTYVVLRRGGSRRGDIASLGYWTPDETPFLANDRTILGIAEGAKADRINYVISPLPNPLQLHPTTTFFGNGVVMLGEFLLVL